MKKPFWLGISGAPERGPVSLTYEAPGHYDNVAIFDADGREIVGCDEYDVIGAWDARELTRKWLLDVLNGSQS